MNLLIYLLGVNFVTYLLTYLITILFTFTADGTHLDVIRDVVVAKTGAGLITDV